MGERAWTGELESYLRDRFVLFFSRIGRPIPFAGLRINPPLEPEEAKYFLLGLEDGLFQLDEDGCVQSELFAANPAASMPDGSPSCASLRRGRPDSGDSAEIDAEKYRLFRHDPPPFRFFRERVCHLSTASFLILKRGWLRSHIVVDSRSVGNRTEADRADILVKSPSGAPLICVAVKKNVPELQKLMADLRNCCNRGSHREEDCGFPQNHPRYEYCARHRPAYFWGVAPGADICLKLVHDDRTITLETVPSLPQRSVMELE